jgi:uncharacterized C2H2 Zn-finger protein
MPGRVRIEYLPPEVAKRIVARAGRQKRVRGSTRDDDRSERWRCHNCGAVFRAYAAAERHANQPGHRRIEFLL